MRALADRLDAVMRALLHARGQRTFAAFHTCRHFRRNGDAAHCGLRDEPLRSDQTARICREHEPTTTGS